jgi:Zn-dependent M28 family amino/carboxypeptidase
MMRFSALALLVPSVLAAQQPRGGGITAAEIDGHLRFLSSDALEGRAPATRGGRLAAEYIASQLRSFGLRPGLDTSYFQTVPIDVVTADKASVKLTASEKATASLRFPEDVVVWAGSAVHNSAAKGELVFVGYGANAPEYSWDDYKDTDVKGKVLLVLVNDPPAPANEPQLFGGRAMTYYGRWTYKFEEAERRGAAGMLIVHTTDAAGYGWQTVVGSWAAGNRMLPRPADQPPPLGARGWITDSAATALLHHAGLDLADLRARATRRDFRPVATGITMDIAFRNSVDHLRSENVVGVVRGSDPDLRDEHVTFSAHWDHFGIGPAVNGDSIYNGTEDNASGTADLLAIARAAAAGAAPRRSLVFVFVTGEESGLLGSKFYAEHPTVPAQKIVANLNVDGGNLLGRTRDLRVLGETKSSLGPALRRFVRPRAMTLTPDEHPERGYFYRSDHFSFAKAGIPSVSIGAGSDYIGKPKGWGLEQEEDYTNKRYHQPSDEYRPDFDLSGAVQLSEIVLGFGRLIANTTAVPTWNADAEFRALRKPITETQSSERAKALVRAAQ